MSYEIHKQTNMSNCHSRININMCQPQQQAPTKQRPAKEENDDKA